MSNTMLIQGLTKKFDLGSFHFLRDNYTMSTLDHIKNNNFFNEPVIENLYFLFSNVPLLTFSKSNRSKYGANYPMEDIQWFTLFHDEYRWSAHIAAPYLSLMTKEWDYIFGFASQELEEKAGIHTFLHSFNAQANLFVDPTIECHGLLETIDSYIGINIPLHIIHDILFWNKAKGITGNVWRYLKDKVLVSHDETMNFISVLKNQTEWVYNNTL